MRFSMLHMLAGINLLALLFALTFVAPLEVGFPVLLIISLAVVAPMLWVAVFHCKGAARAFVLGCMVAGTPHFVFSIFSFVYLWFNGFDVGDMTSSSDEVFLRYSSMIGYVTGLMGGCTGLLTFIGINRLQQSRDDADTNQEIDAPDPLD